MGSTPPPIELAGSTLTCFIGVTSGTAARATNWAGFAGAFATDTPVAGAVEDFFRNGGTTAWVAPVSRLTPAAVARAAAAMPDDVALVAVIADPPASASIIAAVSRAIADRAAMLLIEAPWATVAEATAAMTSGAASAVGADGPNAAVYWPRVRRAGASPTSAGTTALGAVAGVVVRTDDARGVFKAPAGSDAALRGIRSPTVDLRSEDLDALARLGVNGIRPLPQSGPVVWGARTVSVDPEWRYVPVRRTALVLEKSLRQGLGWVVFEPNTEPTWALVRTAVGQFMHARFRDGYFAGQVANEAYFVRCDQSTMTQAEIDDGTVVCLVGFAPLRPAEFVTLRIVARADG